MPSHITISIINPSDHWSHDLINVCCTNFLFTVHHKHCLYISIGTLQFRYFYCYFFKQFLFYWYDSIFFFFFSFFLYYVAVYCHALRISLLRMTLLHCALHKSLWVWAVKTERGIEFVTGGKTEWDVCDVSACLSLTFFISLLITFVPVWIYASLVA